MAIFAMLNSYMHDLATAVFAMSAITAYLLYRSDAMKEAPASFESVARGVVRVGFFALVWTLLGGMIRGMTYREYEWVEAAGRDQVPVLVVKHVILASMVIAGLVVLYRVRRLVRAVEAGGSG
jgi:hypothetical protein